MSNVEVKVTVELGQQTLATLGEIAKSLSTISSPPAEGKGKGKKTEEAAPAATTAPTSPPPPPPPPPAGPTLDEVRNALKAYAAIEGNPAAIELLKSFGTESISGLKPEKYAEFIAKAKG